MTTEWETSDKTIETNGGVLAADFFETSSQTILIAVVIIFVNLISLLLLLLHFFDSSIDGHHDARCIMECHLLFRIFIQIWLIIRFRSNLNLTRFFRRRLVPCLHFHLSHFFLPFIIPKVLNSLCLNFFFKFF